MADLILLSIIVSLVGLGAMALYPSRIDWQSDSCDRDSEFLRLRSPRS
jgi:hypothetical protein